MNKRGSILIITVWVLVILSFFVVGLSRIAKTQMRYTAHLQDRAKAYYLARAGIERAIVELKSKDISEHTALNELVFDNEEPLGDGFFTLGYTLGVGSLRSPVELYGVMDESSKIDINSAPAGVLATMFERAAEIGRREALDLAQAVVDWRSRDADPIVQEKYENSGLAYTNKGAKFEILEELQLVRGMTREIYRKVRDIITVYDTKTVNINTAGFEVLYALGLNEALCERIIEYRQGSDGTTGTKDDNVFESAGSLRNIGFLFTEDSIQINSLVSGNIAGTHSETFRIISTGLVKRDYGTVRRNIICVLRLRTEQEPEILYWHEN